MNEGCVDVGLGEVLAPLQVLILDEGLHRIQRQHAGHGRARKQVIGEGHEHEGLARRGARREPDIASKPTLDGGRLMAVQPRRVARLQAGAGRRMQPGRDANGAPCPTGDGVLVDDPQAKAGEGGCEVSEAAKVMEAP